MDVDWKFICLRIVNEDLDWANARPGYERGVTVSRVVLLNPSRSGS